jgi:hypothetical protein
MGVILSTEGHTGHLVYSFQGSVNEVDHVLGHLPTLQRPFSAR